MKISVYLLLAYAYLLFPGCSDESQVEEAAAALEADKKVLAKNCVEEKGLALLASLTFYSSEIQGVLGFCKGCHSGPMPDGGIDFSNYDTTAATLASEGETMDKMVTNMAGNHKDSYDADGLALMQDWQANGFARGTAAGGSDDSPFYEDGNSDEDSVDLDDFDPFAEEKTEGNKAPGSKC